MGAPVLNGPFEMPMFREFVPRKIRPWIYVLMAVTFQLSGGLYLGTLSHMMGETALMREDILMCLYANLAGMAIYFPLLFRMKFCFTNKSLLMAAAAGVLICNLLVPHITYLPLLWLICFIEGICKIQGTFECMSTIQLWMTPQRDFTVFFPMLHIVILGSMQVADIIATALMYHYHWSYMHFFISGIMILDLLVLTVCTRRMRMMKKLPLFGIDWLGAVLWAMLLLETAFFFNYGDYYDWLDSPVMCGVAIAAAVTLFFCIGRMMSVRHPYLEPKMWTYRKLVPILVLITMVEIFLATERVLEEAFYEGVMHYEETVSVQMDWLALAGVLAGCLFAYWWMHRMRLNYLRLIIVGMVALAFYLTGFYSLMSSEIHISQLFLPVVCRGFAYAVLSATFMVCLEEIMTFQHFFQALSVFNMLHMVMGGVIGGAIYTYGLSYFMTDNIARYGASVDNVAATAARLPPGEFTGKFMTWMTEISLKEIYGLAAYGCVLLILLFLLYDAPVRRHLKQMPYWDVLRNEVAASLRRVLFRGGRKTVA